MKYSKLLIFVFLLAVGLTAQNPPLQVAGLYDALSFGYGVGNVPGLKVSVGNTTLGSNWITVFKGEVTLKDGTKIAPLNANSPITIGTGANAETVTPSSISCVTPNGPNPCTVAASFTKLHYAGEPISSASIGLYEAINYVNGIGGSVVVSGAWVSAGGTTSIYNAAPSIAGVLTLDNRTGLVVGGGGGGTVALNAVNQVWTGAGSLSLGNNSLIFPIGQNSPIASVVTASGTVGGHAVGGGKFQLNVDPQSYTGTDTTLIDDQMSLGYNRCMNGSSCIPTEPAWFMGWEHNYCVPGNPCTTNLFTEWYMQSQPTPNTATGAPSSGGASRPIFVQVHREPTCILAGNCIINDFELNSDPTIGIGFHDWSNNNSLWGKINGSTFNTNGIVGQSGPSLWTCTGLNSQGCEFNFTNGTVGYRGIPISSTQWEFDMLGTNNWIAYNANRTSLGGSSTFNGNATFSVQAPTGNTNVVMSLGLNASNTADLLRLYSNTGSQLGQISSAGLLTLPNITATGAVIAANVTDSALTSGQCVQAGTGGILTTTGAACGAGGGGITALTGDVTASGTGSVATTLATVNSNVGSFTAANITVNAKGLITAASNGSGGGGNTTSTSLTSGNLPVANGANSIVDSGVGAASGVLTASDIKSNSTSPLLIDSTSSTGGVQFRNSSSTVVGLMNNSGHLTAGAATDLAGTGQAIYAAGDIQVANSQVVKWVGRGTIGSPADGQLQMTNNSQNGFNILCWSLCASGTGFRINNNGGIAQFQVPGGSQDAAIEALNLNLLSTITNTVGSTGSCNFSMPFQGANYKKVLVVCPAGFISTGGISYTFPIAFTNAPGIFSASSNLTTVATASATTSTVTITAALAITTINTFILEGY